MGGAFSGNAAACDSSTALLSPVVRSLSSRGPSSMHGGHQRNDRRETGIHPLLSNSVSSGEGACFRSCAFCCSAGRRGCRFPSGRSVCVDTTAGYEESDAPVVLEFGALGFGSWIEDKNTSRGRIRKLKIQHPTGVNSCDTL